jgi:hypothetical protein
MLFAVRPVVFAAVAAVTVAAGAGCYAPYPPGGVPCDPAKARCPEGQWCVAGASGFVCSADEPGTPDARGGDAASGLCFGTGLVRNLCFPQLPAGTLTISGAASIDTATVGNGNCTTIVGQATGQPSLCVVARETIRVAALATLKVTGPLPLVLVATGAIDVAGTIDVSGHADGTVGPGARMACGGGTAGADATMQGGGGGGAGGSFGGAGGAGGRGAMDNNGGTPETVGAPTFVVGGCPGTPGGAGGGGGGSGAGGPGGGAIYAIARTGITIGGTIAASGGGGKGGTGGNLSGGGAGGGGAGGLIGLDAPAVAVTVTGRLHANGGGGGGGNGSDIDRRGADGSDPAAPGTPAPGGPGGNGGGGNGGAGFAQGAAPQLGAIGINGLCGGGGGGGGAGVIRVFQAPAVLGGAVSPSPM